MTWLFNTFCISGKKELLCVLLGATSAYWNFPENERGIDYLPEVIFCWQLLQCVAIVAAYSQLEVVSQVVSSSHQGSHMPWISGTCCAALQVRPPRPVCSGSPALSCLSGIWRVQCQSRGALHSRYAWLCSMVALCTALCFARPGQSAMMIRLCLLLFFFFPTPSIFSLQWPSHSHHRLRAGGCQGSTDAAIMCGTWMHGDKRN